MQNTDFTLEAVVSGFPFTLSPPVSVQTSSRTGQSSDRTFYKAQYSDAIFVFILTLDGDESKFNREGEKHAVTWISNDKQTKTSEPDMERDD